MSPKDALKGFNHVDLLWPSKYLKAGDLQGKEVTVIIDEIEPRNDLVMQGNRKDCKPVLWLKAPNGRKIEKAMICNKTNGKRIAAMYGPEASEWIGKAITLRAEPETKSDTGEAIRVKQQNPTMTAKPTTSSEPVDAPRATGTADADLSYGPPAMTDEELSAANK